MGAGEPALEDFVPAENLAVIPRLLFTPTQAAIALSIGRSTLYELLASGELDSISIGSSRRIPARALDDFIERRRHERRSERRRKLRAAPTS